MRDLATVADKITELNLSGYHVGEQIEWIAACSHLRILHLRTEVGDAERLLKLGIESETLDKAVKKRLAFQYLSDVRQVTKERIGQEIEGK